MVAPSIFKLYYLWSAGLQNCNWHWSFPHFYYLCFFTVLGTTNLKNSREGKNFWNSVIDSKILFYSYNLCFKQIKVGSSLQYIHRKSNMQLSLWSSGWVVNTGFFTGKELWLSPYSLFNFTSGDKRESLIIQLLERLQGAANSNG